MSDFILTPPELLRRLDSEFSFDFDAAPYPRPSGFDSLTVDWGRRTWLNVPIEKGSSISAWVRKAVDENKKGKLVVMLLPFPRWFRPLLSVDAEFRFPGPIRFFSPSGERAKSEGGGRIPDIITILRPRSKPA